MPKKAELSDEDKALRERLGAAIRMASGQRGFKPKDLAEAAGVSLAHQYRIEAGEQTADVLYLVKVANLMGLSIGALLEPVSGSNAVSPSATQTPSVQSNLGATGGISMNMSNLGDGNVQVGSGARVSVKQSK